MSNSPVRYLEPSQIRAFRHEGSVHPRIEVVDEFVVLSAVVKRVFPQSHPRKYISILESKGKEIGILKTLDGVDEHSRGVIDEELDRRYFTPRILRIDSLKSEAGMWRFNVATQRGDTEFFVRNWRDNAHETSPGRWQIFSVDGARFEILAIDELNERSQRLLDQLL